MHTLIFYNNNSEKRYMILQGSSVQPEPQNKMEHFNFINHRPMNSTYLLKIGSIQIVILIEIE